MSIKPNDFEDWEAQLERELKALPEVAAPPSLMARVMAAVEQAERAPWYHRSWQHWPAPLQGAALLLLGAFFGALCLAGWKLPQLEGVASLLAQFNYWLSGLSVLWRSLELVGQLGLLVLRNIQPLWLAVGLGTLALAYAVFLGLGTCYLRLAWAPTTKDVL